MNILAVGAHFDDVELGCGGAIARHVQQGDKVFVYTATNSQYGNKEGSIVRSGEAALGEAENASRILGYELITGDIPTFSLEFGEAVNGQLIKIIEEKEIEWIYTHWTHDIHHDHINLSLSTLHAARHVNRILMYKSNWYLSNEVFHDNFYIDISDTWDLKEKAIKAYASEYHRVGDRWIEYFKREALNNGLKMGVKYAEAFQVVKWFI